MTRENEFSVAASYFGYFRRDNNTTSSPTKGRDDSKASLSSLVDPAIPHKIWAEDNWTSTDEENAKQVLDNHIEKCSISASLTRLQISQPDDEEEDANAWDQFYTNHGNRFFKDRHYFSTEFPEEFNNRPPAQHRSPNETKTLVEIGCGVGNALLPLLEVSEDHDNDDGNWDVVHGLDISKTAIDIMSQELRFLAFNKMGPRKKVYGHVCDISKTLSLPSICSGVSNVTTLIFCLSAIDPQYHADAAKNVIDTLRPGGILVFRDYGRYDEAQMKLGTSRSKRIKENFYRKHDGTKCFYFTSNDLEELFCTQLGMNVIELKYLRRVYNNKAMSQARRRVWVQGRFQKPFEEEKVCTNDIKIS